MQEIKLSLLGTGFQTTSGARAADSELVQYQTIHVHGARRCPLGTLLSALVVQLPPGQRGRNASAIGTYLTWKPALRMSLLRGITDIPDALSNVR